MMSVLLKKFKNLIVFTKKKKRSEWTSEHSTKNEFRNKTKRYQKRQMTTVKNLTVHNCQKTPDDSVSLQLELSVDDSVLFWLELLNSSFVFGIKEREVTIVIWKEWWETVSEREFSSAKIPSVVYKKGKSILPVDKNHDDQVSDFQLFNYFFLILSFIFQKKFTEVFKQLKERRQGFLFNVKNKCDAVGTTCRNWKSFE
jgi:hypothetical protein